MKNARTYLGVAIFLFLFQGAAWGAGPLKIAVVDMQTLQKKSSSFQRVRGDLEKKLNTMRQKLEAEKDALVRLEEDFRKQSMMLSLDAQEDKKNELERKQRHYKYLYEDLTIEMKNAEDAAKRKIGGELEGVLKKIAEKEGYSAVFERRTPGLLFYDDAIEITDRVIRAFDSQAPR